MARAAKTPTVIRRAAVAAALAALAVPVPAPASALAHAGAVSGAAFSPARVAEAAAVHQAVTAARVAAWGRKAGDARALILAARMLAEIPFRAAPSADAAELSAEDVSPTRFTVAGLLDEAVILARGDGQTLAEIEAVREAAARGVVDSPFGRGPILAQRDVQARQTYWFEVDARGGEILRIAAIGDGDTDIDMVVRDADGRALCEDGLYDHYPVCTLTPGSDARLRVEIINRGAVWTRVRILSN